MRKLEMAPIYELQNNLETRRRSSLMLDLGLMIFLFTFLASALTIAFCETRRVEYVILFAIMSATSMLAAYRFRYLSVGLAGLQILGFMTYTLFRSLVQSVAIVWMDYLWIGFPLLASAGIQLFTYELYRIEHTNEELTEQMESVVLLDSLTGLYNLRAMYIDLQRQMAFCARNEVPISLMVVRLRYRDELQSILSRRNYNQLIQRLADLLSDNVRLEDRCYSVNPKTGEFAILLTCNKAGSDIVRNRILSACSDRDAFSGITDKAIRVDLRIACVQYEKGITNAVEFKHKVDNELQYDV